MDPSLSVSSDPHQPPQFTPFPPPFSTSTPFVSGAAVNPPTHPLFGGPGPVNQNPYNNHVFQPQPQTQPPQLPQPQAGAPVQPHPSFNHPPYSEMICKAIAGLNEPDGSSKMAISRYIERSHNGLPPAHAALLTHHLKTLKNSGVLVMVKKSYKFATSSPESVAVAAAGPAAGAAAGAAAGPAAGAAAGLEVPRSENLSLELLAAASSSSQPQKRGRGRPPKPKPEAQQQQPAPVQPSDVQHNGQPSWEQSESLALAIINPTVEVQESAKRGPGRPRKDGSAPIVQASVMAGIMKRRGRPPGRRAAGRQRKPKSVSSTASVFPYVANGARRRGRPRRADSSGPVAPTGGEIVAVSPGMKRGRGRPPKIGGVISRLMKPKRGRGRPVGRPRKALLLTGATGTHDPAYGELKRKMEVFQEKAIEIVSVLKSVVTSENQAVMQQAIQDLEGIIAVVTVEPPQAMEEEVQPEEAVPPHTEAQTEAQAEVKAEPETEAQTEAQAEAPTEAQTEAQTEVEAHGEEQAQERGGEGQTQTEAEAMQEALF